MKRPYQLRWYEYNLTTLRRRFFFTEIGALIYQWYLLHFEGIISYLYEYEND